jgi:hypothetical protein
MVATVFSLSVNTRTKTEGDSKNVCVKYLLRDIMISPGFLIQLYTYKSRPKSLLWIIKSAKIAILAYNVSASLIYLSTSLKTRWLTLRCALILPKIAFPWCMCFLCFPKSLWISRYEFESSPKWINYAAIGWRIESASWNVKYDVTANLLFLST